MKVVYTPGEGIAVTFVGRGGRRLDLGIDEADELAGKLRRAVAAAYPWKQVFHAYRDMTATYLFLSPYQGFILPHSCIEEGEEELWKLLSKKVPEKRQPKGVMPKRLMPREIIILPRGGWVIS